MYCTVDVEVDQCRSSKSDATNLITYFSSTYLIVITDHSRTIFVVVLPIALKMSMHFLLFQYIWLLCISQLRCISCNWYLLTLFLLILHNVSISYNVISLFSYIYATVQNVFLEETNTFIQQGCIKLIESDSKEDIYNVRKGFYFKRILFFSLHQRFFPQKC